jgi:3D (Asp-Asp-Asp) domain-containing protein
MPNRILLVLLFCTSLSAAACWDVRPAVMPKVIVPAIRTTEQEVSILTPERAIKKDRNEEKDYRVVKAVVTAYCPCAVCCQEMTGRTSTGSNAWRPGIAVDKRAIPYGSFIHVSGYERAEWAIADDTGAAMRRDWKRGIIHIDVRMTYHREAREWGRQILEVKIRKPNK